MKQDKQAGFTLLELLIATTVFSVILLLAATAMIQIGRTYYKGNQQTRVQETARDMIEQISKDIQFSGETVTKASEAKDDLISTQDETFSQERCYGNAIPAGCPGGYPGLDFDSIRTFCVGKKRYFAIMDRRLDPGTTPANHANFSWGQAFVTYNDPGVGSRPGCPTNRPTDLPALVGYSYKELLSPGMILAKLDVDETSPGSGLWTISIRILNTDDKEFINDPGPGLGDWTCKTDKYSSQFCAQSELTTTVRKRVN
jgi:prepilin-type N-terminal cleavage/methylation domain-containing protein